MRISKSGFIKLLVSCALIYIVLCAAGGVFLAELTLRVPRLPLRHASQIQQDYQYRFNAHLTDTSIRGSDGVLLRAWYVRPFPYNGDAVLLLHGVGDNREGMSGYAALFLQKGYAVLLPDSRAHGQSGGTIATYGLLESDDVHRWVQWLQSSSHPNCVYGFGESMGAAIVLESLGIEQNFCAVVADSPYSTFHQVAYDRVGYYVGLGPWFGRTVARLPVEFALAYVDMRYRLNLLHANPEDALKVSKTPVFLIHGGRDRNILPWHSRELAAVDPAATLWLVPGAYHTGARAVARAEFDNRVLTFFASHSNWSRTALETSKR